MQTITSITQAKKNESRVNIELDGRFWIGLSKNDLLKLSLFKGKEINESEKNEIEKIAFNSKLMDKVINYINIRPRSIGEVRDYLVLKKAVPKDEAANIINDLTEREILSDEKFAEWYIETRLNFGVHGVNKIKAELAKKRVDSKITELALKKFSNNEEFQDDQLKKIEEYTEKIIKNMRPLDKGGKGGFELKTKLTQRLMARGFKYEDVKKVINELL